MEACAGPLRLVELDGDRLEVLRGNSVLITRGRVAEDLLDALRRAGCPRSFGPPPGAPVGSSRPKPRPKTLPSRPIWSNGKRMVRKCVYISRAPPRSSEPVYLALAKCRLCGAQVGDVHKGLEATGKTLRAELKA